LVGPDGTCINECPNSLTFEYIDNYCICNGGIFNIIDSINKIGECVNYCDADK